MRISGFNDRRIENRANWRSGVQRRLQIGGEDEDRRCCGSAEVRIGGLEVGDLEVGEMTVGGNEDLACSMQRAATECGAAADRTLSLPLSGHVVASPDAVHRDEAIRLL